MSTSELRSTIAGLSAEVTQQKKHQQHREKVWKHRVAELKKQLEAVRTEVSTERKVEWSDGDYQRGFVHGWNGALDHVKAAIGEVE